MSRVSVSLRGSRRAAVALAVALTCLMSGTAHAQQSAPDDPAPRALRVFLDCRSCDFDYVRTETPWVDYVRDRADADVHVLVTQLGTGAGGTEYTITFVGLAREAARRDTLRFASLPGTTHDLRRTGLTRTIQLGLVPYVLPTPQAAGLRLSYAAPAGDAAAAPAHDRWNAWVFNVGASGSMDREERQQELEFSGEFSAQRVTADWKIGFEGEGNYERERFDIDDRRLTTTSERFNVGGVAVRSLGGHWGAGGEAVVGSSTFSNTRLATRVAAAIEYSVFPYDEATRRQLVAQYSLGVSSYRYREQTIFDRLEETRPTQALVVAYDFSQPWGSADVELESASYLDDLEKFRVEFDAGLDMRLVRGLELNIGGSASLIRDQLEIVKRDATPEEILLQRRALQTDYRYSMYVGISYTFGSIFNSVVNPRFGSGPGDILQ